MFRYVNLLPGDPAPTFRQRSPTNPRYVFDSAAGRYLVLCFYGSMSGAHGQDAVSAARSWTTLFDDNFASFFGVSNDPEDEAAGRLIETYPGIRFFLDFDRSIARKYGAAPFEGQADPTFSSILPRWVILSPALRVLAVQPFLPDRTDIERVRSLLSALPKPEHNTGRAIQAPVLFLPQIFEPELCVRLVDLYREHGGAESGCMRDIDGVTTSRHDYNHKRRRDYNITDADLIALLRERVRRRLVPEIQKAYQFTVSRMERYIVACYSAEDGGHFRPHRDNTTMGTAHRRFAVSINLNSEFEGGEIYFPEYGPQAFKPPVGGAVVFSCSLLHAVTPVRQGERYAFLPFLYDEQAAEIRRQNNPYLDKALGTYDG